jgi:choline dehydrogenase-like flavoprotein
MICAAHKILDSVDLVADVCIVGGGPAGITVALTLAEHGLHVLLLESGGFRSDSISQALCIGDVSNPALHAAADMYRRRQLGGSTSIWGGRCTPLDPVDFMPRPWLDLLSGWPISYDTLVPFWRRAHDWAELGDFDYAATTAVPGGMRPMFDGFTASAISTDRIERFSRPTNFGVAYRDRLARSQHVRVLLYATCTQIVLTGGTKAVRHLVVTTRLGTRLRARARNYVIATGGLEVPRLLLASRSEAPAGVGNASGLVGRTYMCHLAGTSGHFRAAGVRAPWHSYERTADGVYCRRRISVEPRAQQTWRIGNVIARLHHTSIANPAHVTGALSALYLARWLLPAEYRTRLAQRSGAVHLWPHLRNVVADPLTTIDFAIHSLRRRLLAARKYPSITVVPRCGDFTLDIHAEQLPNPDSRITLGCDTDRFGVPQIRIDWRYRSEDIRTVRVAMALIAEAVAANGHGTLSFDPDAVEADILRDGAYGGHHLGTARMSESPATGVVDAQCRVHDVDNLYIASGAVFPTSGQANPTLTIIALAVRLAEHLAARLAAPDRMTLHGSVFCSAELDMAKRTRAGAAEAPRTT